MPNGADKSCLVQPQPEMKAQQGIKGVHIFDRRRLQVIYSGWKAAHDYLLNHHRDFNRFVILLNRSKGTVNRR